MVAPTRAPKGEAGFLRRQLRVLSSDAALEFGHALVARVGHRPENRQRGGRLGAWRALGR
jgi:hypothetical protein